MSLNRLKLKQDIKTAFDAQKTKTENQDQAIDDLADKIATAVEDYVKSITITSTPNLTSPSGPVTGTITNTVS